MSKNKRQICTGYSELDKVIGGFKSQELIVISARNGYGKSAMGLSLMNNIAVRQNIPFGYFSLEMSASSLLSRSIFIEGVIEKTLISEGNIKQPDFNSFLNAVENYYKAPIYINDAVNISLNDLCEEIRTIKNKHKVEIVLIDSVGLIQYEDKTIPREKQISKISSVLKSLAADLNIPILLTTGLKGSIEDQVPTVNDLGPYRGLVEYANYIMLLHGEKWQENSDGSFTRVESETEINISNELNGPLGTVSLIYNPKTIMFEEIE